MISEKERRPINPRVPAYGVNVGPRESDNDEQSYYFMQLFAVRCTILLHRSFSLILNIDKVLHTSLVIVLTKCAGYISTVSVIILIMCVLLHM